MENIACFEQFLLLLRCFQNSSAAKGSKCDYRWERVKVGFPEILLNYLKEFKTLQHKQKKNVLIAKLPRINPFPHIDAFWRLCSRRLFENMLTKEEIAQNKQFHLWSSCFQLYSIIVLSFKGSFKNISSLFSKSSAADLLYVGKGWKKYKEVWKVTLLC